MGGKWYCLVVLNYISQTLVMLNICVCLLALCISSLEKYLQVFCSFFNQVVCFLLLLRCQFFIHSGYYFSIYTWIYNLQIFSHILWFERVLHAQKFFILMKFSLSFFFFFFGGLCLWCYIPKITAKSKIMKLSSLYCSKGFIVVTVTFKGPTSFFCIWISTFSQHHFLKILSFPSLNGAGLLAEKQLPHMWRLTSVLSIPSVFMSVYASTILFWLL